MTTKQLPQPRPMVVGQYSGFDVTTVGGFSPATERAYTKVMHGQRLLGTYAERAVWHSDRSRFAAYCGGSHIGDHATAEQAVKAIIDYVSRADA